MDIGDSGEEETFCLPKKPGDGLDAARDDEDRVVWWDEGTRSAEEQKSARVEGRREGSWSSPPAEEVVDGWALGRMTWERAKEKEVLP